MKRSAGLLMYRRTSLGLEALLAHPGGPFFRNRDLGAWTLPKGLVEESEEAIAAARREFEEETGFTVPLAELLELGTVRLRSGKIVEAWAVEGDCDTSLVSSNTFELEWPPRSGNIQHFPEVDRAEFFSLAEARKRINPAQSPFIDRLEELFGSPPGNVGSLPL